jgi:hypothetical protein
MTKSQDVVARFALHPLSGDGNESCTIILATVD